MTVKVFFYQTVVEPSEDDYEEVTVETVWDAIDHCEKVANSHSVYNDYRIVSVTGTEDELNSMDDDERECILMDRAKVYVTDEVLV